MSTNGYMPVSHIVDSVFEKTPELSDKFLNSVNCASNLAKMLSGISEYIAVHDHCTTLMLRNWNTRHELNGILQSRSVIYESLINSCNSFIAMRTAYALCSIITDSLPEVVCEPFVSFRIFSQSIQPLMKK